MSYGATISRLEQKREETESALASIPKRPRYRKVSKALTKLSSEQFDTALNYFVFELMPVVNNNPLGEPADLGEWFEELNAAQQEQVIEVYNGWLHADHGLILYWYDDYGPNGGYRYELATYPVASR
ncbi:MAG: hypothetical protein JWN12_188 [Candidatus Saccharibacteria bacterium]|nr:hypothetical protein [Candidatus Saccharibacteria bacterium]